MLLIAIFQQKTSNCESNKYFTPIADHGKIWVKCHVFKCHVFNYNTINFHKFNCSAFNCHLFNYHFTEPTSTMSLSQIKKGTWLPLYASRPRTTRKTQKPLQRRKNIHTQKINTFTITKNKSQNRIQ